MKVGDKFLFFNPSYLEAAYNGSVFEIIEDEYDGEVCLRIEDGIEGDELEWTYVNDSNHITPREFREMAENVPEFYNLLNGKRK